MTEFVFMLRMRDTPGFFVRQWDVCVRDLTTFMFVCRTIQMLLGGLHTHHRGTEQLPLDPDVHGQYTSG